MESAADDVSETTHAGLMTPDLDVGVTPGVFRHANLVSEVRRLNLYVAQGLQIFFVLGFSPLLKGIMERYRARVAGRHGPPVWQPYRDLWKWSHKETVRSHETSFISEWAPIAYFIAPLLVAMLIPVLTAFPLPFAWMGDMLAGGMILGAGGVALLLAALDSGSVYPALGVSRIRLIAAFTEPLSLLLVFIAASAAKTTIPFIVNQTLSAPSWLFTPAHLFIVVGWFLLLLAEAGRIPVDNPSTSQELSMIDPARTFESSGTDLVLYEWGGWMKFLILSVILCNVLATPWGLAGSSHWQSILEAVGATAFKTTVLGLAVISFEAGFAKLRLIRNVDFLMAAIALAALGGLVANL